MDKVFLGAIQPPDSSRLSAVFDDHSLNGLLSGRFCVVCGQAMACAGRGARAWYSKIGGRS